MPYHLLDAIPLHNAGIADSPAEGVQVMLLHQFIASTDGRFVHEIADPKKADDISEEFDVPLVPLRVVYLGLHGNHHTLEGFTVTVVAGIESLKQCLDLGHDFGAFVTHQIATEVRVDSAQLGKDVVT
jgi:hypothetical protein